MNKLFDIIHEDDELLVINKRRSGLSSDKGDEFSSLISRVRLHLGRTRARIWSIVWTARRAGSRSWPKTRLWPVNWAVVGNTHG